MRKTSEKQGERVPTPSRQCTNALPVSVTARIKLVVPSKLGLRCATQPSAFVKPLVQVGLKIEDSARLYKRWAGALAAPHCQRFIAYAEVLSRIPGIQASIWID